MSSSENRFRRPRVIGGGPIRHRRNITQRSLATRRLLFEAAEEIYDGELDIDWGSAVMPGVSWMPDEFCSLFGTTLWAQMSAAERLTLTTFEFAEIIALAMHLDSAASMLTFKTIARDRVLADDRARFLLTVVDDLARNVSMYSRLIAATGVDPMMSGHRTSLPARFTLMLPRRTMAVSTMLLSAQFLNGLTRAVERGAEVQPHCRYMLEIRHGAAGRITRFARAELADRHTSGLMQMTRGAHSVGLATLVASLGWRLVADDAYIAAGLDPVESRYVATRRETRTRRLEAIVGPMLEICAEDGILAGPLFDTVLHLGGARSR